MSIINVADIVEQNGETVRQNNMDMVHDIPLGTLVEIQRDSDDDISDDPEMERYQIGGLRLFVVNHSRDCDGTPLYDMSFDKSAYRNWEELDRKVKEDRFYDQLERGLTLANWWTYGGKILRHYSRDSLKVVK